MRKLLLAGVALAALATSWTSTADAAAVLSARVFEDGVQITPLDATSGTGFLSFGGTTPNFSVSSATFGAFGPDAVNMGTQVTSVSTTTSFSGTHMIRFEITQTGLSSKAAGGTLASFASTFTDNVLINGGFIPEASFATYVDASNSAFGKGTLLSTINFIGGPTNDSGALIAGANLSEALFSETVVISAKFTGAGAQFQGSTQLVAVPEPASLALLGSGLLGIGLVRRRRPNAA